MHKESISDRISSLQSEVKSYSHEIVTFVSNMYSPDLNFESINLKSDPATFPKHTSKDSVVCALVPWLQCIQLLPETAIQVLCD